MHGVKRVVLTSSVLTTVDQYNIKHVFDETDQMPVKASTQAYVASKVYAEDAA